MNTTYLIDLENVKSGGFDGASDLTESDEIIVFYSEKADTLKIPIISYLLKTRAQIKFYKSKNGILNAMDFDIVSVLGIIYNDERQFFIVSKDKGFDVVVERYRSFGKQNVSRKVTIGAARQKQEQEGIGEDVMFSAPEIPEIEPDRFEEELSKAMEQMPEPAKAADEPAPEPELTPEPVPEAEPTETVPQAEIVPQAESAKAPEPEAKPKKPKKASAAPGKKKPVSSEMSRLDKGKVNQFLNNLMGAKHEQPMTKDELKLIRETAEVSKNKNAFYNALRKKLGNEKGIALYNRVKDDYDEIAKFIADIRK